MTDYKTIDELMEGKKPGEVKIRTNTSSPDQSYMPVYKHRDGEWLLINQTNEPFWEPSTLRVWTLYTEPNKKVVRYQWVVHHRSRWTSYTGFFTDEEFSKEVEPDGVYKRLDYTATEFEG